MIGAPEENSRLLVTWTNKRNDRLKELWESGKYTASQTAEILAVEFECKVTRNVVIGKVNRMKLKKQPRGKKPSGKPRAPKTKKAGPAKLLSWRPLLPESIPGDIGMLKGDVWKPVPGSEPKPLIVVSIADTCRWPIGEEGPYLFCGNPIHKGQFCQHHHAIAYRPTPARISLSTPKRQANDPRLLDRDAA